MPLRARRLRWPVTFTRDGEDANGNAVSAPVGQARAELQALPPASENDPNVTVKSGFNAIVRDSASLDVQVGDTAVVKLHGKSIAHTVRRVGTFTGAAPGFRGGALQHGGRRRYLLLRLEESS